MRNTLLNQIKRANRFYAIRLNPYTNGSICRYAVYALQNNELQPLWPSDSHLDVSQEITSLPNFIYSKRKQYPAYHFRLSGYGFSKLNELRMILQEIRGNKETHLELLSGAIPTNHD